MSQVHKSIIAQPVRAERKLNRRATEIVAAAIAIATTGVATALILTSLSAAPAAQVPTERHDLVDGWMPAAAAAQAARLARLQDGYFPGLVSGRSGGGQSATLTDGWESSLLP